MHHHHHAEPRRRRRFTLTRLAGAALAMLVGCGESPTGSPKAAKPTQPVAERADAHNYLPLDQVRIGMKGYGLSVFHGTKIEPFACEVVSIEHNFAPRRSVIWIRCPDDRMQLSGPVQGMSGSPIFLWTDDPPEGPPEAPPRERTPGKGGRMIGAFAYGYGLTKDCYVGVQPYEQMLTVASHATDEPDPAAPRASARGRRLASALLRTAEAHGVNPQTRRRASAMVALSQRDDTEPPTDAPLPSGPSHLAGGVRPMMLPLAIPSAKLAALLEPVFAEAGVAIRPLAGASAGKPPAEIDLEPVRHEPGAVLAIPLAFGDMDLSASGTVTDVLPDGRVMAFGHAMFAEGPAALPMATGFVHMVMPSITNSFKLGGSGVIRGAIVRDENAAVVGTPDGHYTSAPVRVHVEMPGQAPATYNYRVVHHEMYGPMLTGVVSAESVVAAQELPVENTLSVEGELHFTGGHTIQLSSLVPGAASHDVVIEVAIPTLTMVQNRFEPIELESADLTARVEPTMRVATIVGGRLHRAQVAPGQTLGAQISLQPYGQPMRTMNFDVPIPDTLDDGEYNLLIADAQTYQQVLQAARPHLMRADNVNELVEALRTVLSIRSDALYALLELPEVGLAVGRTELPSLPSSRQAIIAAPTSTHATAYPRWRETIVPMDTVPGGQLRFTVTVNKHLAESR